MATTLPSSDGRPPGDTARTPGNRTPPKALWIDESREEPVVQATGSSHLLDERALDVSLSLLIAPKLPSNTS